jgi:WD40 repeat protein
MHRHSWRGTLFLLVVVFAGPAVVGQPPPKPPALPAIAPNLARLDATIGGLDGPGTALASSESAGIVAAACETGTIHYWGPDVVRGIRVGEGAPDCLHAHQGPVTALAWNGGPVLASAGADQKLLLWSMPDGAQLHSLTPTGTVRALALSPDGKILASAGDDAAVQLWDPAAGKPLSKLVGHSDWLLCLAFSPDGKLLASGGYDGTVRLWDVATSKKLLDIVARPPMPPDASNTVMAVAFAPDSKLLAAGGTDAQVHLFNVADGKLARSLPGHTSSVTALAFHPGGALLASASKDRTVRLWVPANGQMIKALEGHTAWVEGVAFLLQGTRLASVGADQTVRLWDLTEKK